MADEMLNKPFSTEIVSGQDYVFNARSLGASAAITSPAFECGNIIGGIQVKITADEEIINASPITIEVSGSDDEDGSYTVIKTIATLAAGTIAAGDTMVAFVPDDQIPHWAKIIVTTAEDLSTKKVTGVIEMLER